MNHQQQHQTLIIIISMTSSTERENQGSLYTLSSVQPNVSDSSNLSPIIILIRVFPRLHSKGRQTSKSLQIDSSQCSSPSQGWMIYYCPNYELKVKDSRMARLYFYQFIFELPDQEEDRTVTSGGSDPYWN